MPMKKYCDYCGKTRLTDKRYILNIKDSHGKLIVSDHICFGCYLSTRGDLWQKRVHRQEDKKEE